MTIEQELILRERLNKGAITWIIDCGCPFLAIKQFYDYQETTALGRIKTDVLLIADESLSTFSFDDVSEAGRGEYSFDVFTITKLRDYGTIDDLDLEGGFGYMKPDDGFDIDLGRVVEFRVKFKTRLGHQVELCVILARVEKMEFVSRFLVAEDIQESVRMSALFMRHHWCGFNPQRFTGSWPTKIAAVLGATRLISDEGSIKKRFEMQGPSEKDESVIYARVVEKYPWFERLPQAGIIRKLCQLDTELSLFELGWFSEQQQGRGIRPELRVGELARLTFETYFQSADRQDQEIARLQDGEYCHETFLLNSTMPALVPVSAIESAPEGSHVGERGFYQNHYYARPILEADGIKYRLVNDWKEPPNPRDNRTPLEDWILRMGLGL